MYIEILVHQCLVSVTLFAIRERGGSVVECRTPEREVGGSKPTAAVLCPWARHFTPRKYWLITQEAVAPSRHDWKIVDWDVKPQHKQTNKQTICDSNACKIIVHVFKFSHFQVFFFFIYEESRKLPLLCLKHQLHLFHFVDKNPRLIDLQHSQIVNSSEYVSDRYVFSSQFTRKISHESRHDKTNKMSVRPAKPQISLGIRPVWSESSLCAHLVAKDPRFLHADSKDWSDRADTQADLSLRWAYSHFVGFVMSRIICIFMSVHSTNIKWIFFVCLLSILICCLVFASIACLMGL